MQKKSLNELQSEIKNFVEKRNWQTSSSDILIHLTEELGEVARNILQSKNYGGQHTSNKEDNMGEELSDMLYLILKLANSFNINLCEAFEDKMKKTGERYPAST